MLGFDRLPIKSTKSFDYLVVLAEVLCAVIAVSFVIAVLYIS